MRFLVLVLFFFCNYALRGVVTAQATSALPKPSGKYVTGVLDFEFQRQVVDNDDAQQMRKILVRAWYPACLVSDFEVNARVCGIPTTDSVPFGPLRTYFEDGEREAVFDPFAQVFSGAFDLNPLMDSFNETITNSYLDAPLAPDLLQQSSTSSSLGVVVFSTGALGNVGAHTALTEELASQGLVVFSVSHPGGTFIRYTNGDVLPVDMNFLMGLGTPKPEGHSSDDIAIRYEARKKFLEPNFGLNPFIPLWRDDKIALVDWLQELKQQQNDTTATADANNNATSDHADSSIILSQIVNKLDTTKIVYGGMSFGATAAASAAQIDERAVGVFNLDEEHKSMDLFNTSTRTPYLNIARGNTSDDGPFPNEFFFEPIQTMGSDPRVRRVGISGAVHLEFLDLVFGPGENRAVFGGGRVDSASFHAVTLNAISGFVNEALGIGGGPWLVQDSIALYPGHADLWNVEYVAEWASNLTTSVGPVPTDSPTPAPVVNNPATTAPTSNSTSASFATFYQPLWIVLSLNILIAQLIA